MNILISNFSRNFHIGNPPMRHLAYVIYRGSKMTQQYAVRSFSSFPISPNRTVSRLDHKRIQMLTLIPKATYSTCHISKLLAITAEGRCEKCAQEAAWMKNVITQAEEQFSDNPYKVEIIQVIIDLLDNYQKQGSIIRGGPSKICQSESEKVKEEMMEAALDSFFDREDLFHDCPMTVQGGHRYGYHKPWMQNLIRKAEEFVKKGNLNPGERSKLLFRIREVVYTKEFIQNPAEYLEAWLKNEDHSILFPENRALEFFLNHLQEK